MFFLLISGFVPCFLFNKISYLYSFMLF